MSWKPEVQTDGSGKWYGNALRFATREEAEANARDLAGRWLLVRAHRASESEDPVNYDYTTGRLVEVKPKAETFSISYGSTKVGEFKVPK